MTAQPGHAPVQDQPLPVPPATPQPYRIDPVPGSPLDVLMDRRAAALAARDEAIAAFDAVDAEVKTLTTAAVAGPDGQVPERIIIGGNAGRVAMLLMWKKERRFDQKLFKNAYAALYEQFRVWKGHWEMRKLED